MSEALENEIASWRARVVDGSAITAADGDELEAHLREQIGELVASGLADDEAFLIAVKRLGGIDRLTAEFAREHSDRLWKQLALGHRAAPGERRSSVLRMVGFAIAAAVIIQAARLLAELPGQTSPWLVRNLGLFALVPLVAYFASAKALAPRRMIALGAAIAATAVILNVYPFTSDSQTQVLLAAHLPVLLWFAVGLAYRGDARPSAATSMEFVRFSGEWFIYWVLIALGGGVLTALTSMVLMPIAPAAIDDVLLWVLPSGAVAAVVVAAWLVEAKQSVIENIAPVLSMIFTPLFALMLVVSAVIYAITGVGRDFDRALLIGFDTLLIVVLALVLYGLSARDPLQRVGAMDVIRLIAVAAALVLDLLVLVSMSARIGDLGLTPNRVVALGLNLLLVVNLAAAAWVSVRMLAGRVSAHRLERVQTAYLPIYGLWALIVVVVLPPLFLFA